MLVVISAHHLFYSNDLNKKHSCASNKLILLKFVICSSLSFKYDKTKTIWFYTEIITNTLLFQLNK